MTERVMVFIDGQNLYKAVSKSFKARVHPVLLARALAGDRDLVETRYYSGMHLPREDPKIHGLAMRRHKLIRDTGVTVIERTLRYHWEWSIADRLPPPHKADEGDTHTAKVKRRRVAREKGIDLALGLDAVTAAFTNAADTIVVVSRDRDLMEVAAEINERASTADVRVEVALVGQSGVLEGYDYTHQIDEALVDQCRDDFDYREKLNRTEVREFLATLV